MALKRINITIDDAELSMARASGETVSGYIRRLIREDNHAGTVRMTVPPELHSVLEATGVLGDLRSEALQARVLRVLVDYGDEKLASSRARLQAAVIDLADTTLA